MCMYKRYLCWCKNTFWSIFKLNKIPSVYQLMHNNLNVKIIVDFISWCANWNVILKLLKTSKVNCKFTLEETYHNFATFLILSSLSELFGLSLDVEKNVSLNSQLVANFIVIKYESMNISTFSITNLFYFNYCT